MFRLNLVRYFLTFVFLFVIGFDQTGWAATKAEIRDFNAAAELLQFKIYDQAEERFAKFLETYPETTNRPIAILHQAQARFFQTNVAGAVELLQTQLPNAGVRAHEYQYWIGTFFLKSGNSRAAADAFSSLIKNFPNSSYHLEACYQQAVAEFKLGSWSRVIELLHTPGGEFDIVAKTQPNSGFVVDGFLLLADALFKLGRFDEAEKIIAQLETRALTPTAKWRQIYLLCRVQMAKDKPALAFETSTDLLAAAQVGGNREMLPKSVLLRGEILEKLNRLPEAIQAYEQNLGEASSATVPAEIRRQSFFKTVDLSLAQGETTNAIRRLETFIEKNPTDASMDLAMLTLGELRLKQFTSLPGGTNSTTLQTSNLFARALTNFNTVITNFPQSPHLGKVYLNRGWCFWIQEKFPAAEQDFLEATRRMPISEDRAVARFKLADTQLQQTNYAAAITNYQMLIHTFIAYDRVTNSLFESALYQIVRASLKIENFAAAKDAMYKLLDWFPEGSLGGRSLLLVGQHLNRIGEASEARDLYLDFLKGVPNASRAAEIKLAIAQTYVREMNWPAALAEYNNWVTNFSDHPLLPQGEYSRGLAFAKAGAGHKTNAFNVFTNFVAKFPTNNLAPLAQNWIADFYFSKGDFLNAEKSYQELYQKFPSFPTYAYQARLMAGRSAYERSNYPEAAKYFSELITLLDENTNSPAALKTEAYFALGDTFFEHFLSNTNVDIGQAITAFSRISKDLTNRVGVLAAGRIGDCYFQQAGLDPAQADARYRLALDYYGMVIDSKFADASARSQAEVGVGHVCVKQAARSQGAAKKDWLDAAMRHYMNVVTRSKLRDGEFFDPKWMYEAGIAAAKVCESSEQWEQARNIYQKLSELLPPLRASLEKRIASAEMRLSAARN